MSSDQGIDLTIEQILAAVLNTTGRIVVTKEAFLKDYANANIRFEELDSDSVAIELTKLEVPDDSGTTSKDNA